MKKAIKNHLAKSSVWYILKSVNAVVNSITSEVLKDHARQQMCMMVKKTPFTTLRQVPNMLETTTVSLPKSTIKRHLYEIKYRRFTTTGNILVKKLPMYWNQNLCTDETKIKLYQNKWKRKVWRMK